MSENLSHLAGRKGAEQSLFEQLVQRAKASGTPREEDMHALAREFLFGEANVYGAASFYDFTREEHKDVKVRVCNGSACMLAGTQDKVKAALRKDFPGNQIGEVCCLGRCHENGSFQFRGKNYSAKSEAEIVRIVHGDSAARSDAGADAYHVGTNMAAPLLTGRARTADELGALLLDVLKRDRENVLGEIKKANVRGRGGAGFPMGLKLESCLRTEADQKFVVCNADEGDPGAYSDRYLMEKQPHLLLFGMMVAAYVVGATRGVLYIRGEYPESIAAVRAAISELEQGAWLGENIQGTGFDFRFKVIEGAGAYICGEETALLSSIEGQRPEVRVRPPYPTQMGLFNMPTVVNNVETSACLYAVMKHGGEAFAKLGTAKSSGSKLVCLDGFFKRPGLYEIEMGTPFSEVVYEHGQGFREPVKAVHVGGPLGGLVPVAKIPELTVDFESFAQNGFLLGHAGVVCVPESYPLIAYLEHLFEFTAAESCGKCFPCSIGSTRGKEMLAAARHDGRKIDPQLMADLLETLELGSLCALGGGLPLGVKNAMKYFEPELKAYFA
jgi:NADH-quinone oxidoreductase subunit F